MISKRILLFNQSSILSCDGICEKAWGINNRPKVALSEVEDDYAFLSDIELGTAPSEPRTYEGGCSKPLKAEDKLNKWCLRECERSSNCKESEVVKLKDFTERVYNIKKNI